MPSGFERIRISGLNLRGEARSTIKAGPLRQCCEIEVVGRGLLGAGCRLYRQESASKRTIPKANLLNEKFYISGIKARNGRVSSAAAPIGAVWPHREM